MNIAPARHALAFLALIVALCATAASASADVVINEIESQGGIPGDWVEIYNPDSTTVGITGYVLRDNDDTHTYTLTGDMAPHSYLTVDVETAPAAGEGFALGPNDQVRLFKSAGGALVDSYSWTSHAQTTYGRCPDGTGSFYTTFQSSKNTSNGFGCSVATPWPGASTVSVVSDATLAGTNLSGLAYQPSGTAAPGVLWAVRNKDATLYRLLWNGTKWTPDTANGWSGGRLLHYPAGTGNPDSEGVTLAAGDANTVYVSTERDGDNDTVSRPAVLRFDVSGAGGSLNATRDWNLTPDLPGLDPNLGLEAITWIPDSVLTAKGFKDQATGVAYNPATYPDHGSGLFFVGIEQTGEIRAYVLNQSASTFTKVATIESGFPSVMDLEFEPESGLLWAVCDDNCSGRAKTFDVAPSGVFLEKATYERPTAMANLNNEGFAIAPRAECSGSLKPAFWIDDTGPNDVLRAGKVSCTDLPGTTTTPPPTTTPPGGTPPGGSPPPGGTTPPPAGDKTAPVVTKLKLSRSAVKLTVSEDCRAQLTVDKRVGRKFKRLKRFTVSLKKGTRTVKFKGRIAKSKLRRGKLRVGLVCTDAAGNASSKLTKTIG